MPLPHSWSVLWKSIAHHWFELWTHHTHLFLRTLQWLRSASLAVPWPSSEQLSSLSLGAWDLPEARSRWSSRLTIPRYTKHAVSSNEHWNVVDRLETIQILQILPGERGTELLVSGERSNENSAYTAIWCHMAIKGKTRTSTNYNTLQPTPSVSQCFIRCPPQRE